MVKKEVFIVFLVSVSILLINWLLLLRVYSALPEIVATHINILGEPDAYGNKKSLIYGLGVNTFLIGVMYFLIRNPKYANYPVEVNDSNRAGLYAKMQFFLSVVAVLTSLAFSFMVTKELGSKEPIYLILAYSIMSPIIVLLFFRNKKIPSKG